MDYNKIAKEIINCVGGKENITNLDAMYYPSARQRC